MSRGKVVQIALLKIGDRVTYTGDAGTKMSGVVTKATTLASTQARVEWADGSEALVDLTALEFEEPKRSSKRHGLETPGHEDGCRCRECDPSR